MILRTLAAIFILTVAILAAPPSPALAQPATAQVPGVLSGYDVSDAGVTFQVGAGYSSVVLTVAGPRGFRSEQSFASGEQPTFASQSRLPDGAYVFELRGAISLPEAVMQQLHAARSTGDNLLVSALLTDAGVDPDRATASINIARLDGRFISPATGVESANSDTQGTTGSDSGYRKVGLQASAQPSWVEAEFHMNAADGSQKVYSGYILPPAGPTTDAPDRMRAFIRPADGSGAWVEGYFAREEGSFRFVDQTVGSGQPFDYLSGRAWQVRDQVISDDLAVQGSACVGQDCGTAENFGFDTIRLKENNLRLKFEDTSSTGSFPSVDWQITANDSNNGGANYLAFENTSSSTRPFSVLHGAPNNSLYVSSTGRLGIKTAAPAVEMHSVDGDTPTLRMQQDASSGFSAQTWDVAGNETNFFVRDVSNSNKLPFRIRPGAPTSSIDIQPSGQVQILAGTVAAPAIGFTTDTDTGIFLSGTDALTVATDGMAGLTVNSDQSSTFGGALNSSTGQLVLGADAGQSTVIIDDNQHVGIGVAPTTILTVVQNSATDPVADAWTVYSSRRWKTDIETLDGALDTVQRLRGVSYTWKDSGKADIGLIAEEVGAIIPEIVVFEENGVDAQSVDYARLVAVLIEAVKEQQAQLEARDATVAELSARLNSLESRMGDVLRAVEQGAASAAPGGRER